MLVANHVDTRFVDFLSCNYGIFHRSRMCLSINTASFSYTLDEHIGTHGSDRIENLSSLASSFQVENYCLYSSDLVITEKSNEKCSSRRWIALASVFIIAPRTLLGKGSHRPDV